MVRQHLSRDECRGRHRLPPPERRGLVFVDSSFERAPELKRLTQGCVEAHRKFATGIYALWYPPMERAVMQVFERRVAATGIRKILQLEISVHPRDWTLTLRGCGLLVVNPPFGFEAAARAILAWLWTVLSRQGDGEQRVRWLAPQ
jgi:23S rRNA (adenine2030-N6)-methyltransferase